MNLTLMLISLMALILNKYDNTLFTTMMPVLAEEEALILNKYDNTPNYLICCYENLFSVNP